MEGVERTSSRAGMRWVAEFGERVEVDVGVVIAGTVRWS